MRTVVTAVGALVLVLAGCGGSQERSGQAEASAVPATSAPTDSTAPDPPAAASTTAKPRPRPTGVEIMTATSDFGTVLFDGSGQAIYLFDKETGSRAECYDGCAEAWPPVVTDGEPRAAGEVRPGLLGTTPRTDGATQVTYAGHPLYYYAHEGKDQVLCHNVSEYGGLWLVLTARGNPAPA